MPVATFRASQEHRDGLIREFVLMSIDEAGAGACRPAWWRSARKLNGRLAGETAALDAQVDHAGGGGTSRSTSSWTWPRAPPRP